MQIEEFLERSAQLYANKVALVCGDQKWTYELLEEGANKLAHGLITQGVERWDRVAIYLDNSVESVLSLFAILKVGAVFFVLSPSMKLNRLTYLLNHCRARALITDAMKLESIRDHLPQMPHLKVVFIAGGSSLDLHGDAQRFVPLSEMLEQGEHTESPGQSKAIDIDPAALIYTSGSTGRPKGVVLTHLNIVSATTSIATYLENTSNDIILSVLPLSYSYGLTQLMTAFQVGATLILERSFRSPYEVVATIAREGVTGFAFVPTIASSLLELDLRGYDFSALRYVTNAADALPTPTIRRLREILSHVKIFSMYGLTECIRVSYLPPDQIDIRPASVGRGMPNEEVYIVDEEGHRLGPEMIGELVVRGTNVMKGYWELPDETEKVLKPGPLPGERVFHTGDLFRMDNEGYLYFVSRKDDMIKTCGEKVSPREIEEVLCSLDAVAEASVVGVPDEILGQAIKAVIRLKKGAQVSQKDIVRHCRQQLEDFMVPTFVEFRDTFPKTSTGKIRKRELAEPEGVEQ